MIKPYKHKKEVEEMKDIQQWVSEAKRMIDSGYFHEHKMILVGIGYSIVGEEIFARPEKEVKPVEN